LNGVNSTDDREREMQASCLVSMRRFREAADQARLAKRTEGLLWWRLLQLLHYLVACKGRTLSEATQQDLDEWLAPAFGLYEHDTRLQLFGLLAKYEDYSLLRSWPPRRGAGLRRAKEFLFHGRLHREISRRTRAFFESIVQEDIVASEQGALPLYRAMWEFMPSLGEEALDSDEEVVRRLYRLGLTSDREPAILDIGCSHGRLLQRIAKDFPKAKLTGAELAEWYHAQLIERGITPIRSHAGDLALDDASQDVVVSTDVIEHLRHPVEMVREIHRVLKPGGIFCIGGPAANANYYNLNPFTYLWIAAGNVFEPLLPPFHNLYAPLTPLKIVHYGFSRHQLRALFQPFFASVKVEMSRYYSLKKFGLARVAPHLPVLRGMGQYCLAFGRKDA
jgi:SAM-dependent methyltransferase